MSFVFAYGSLMADNALGHLRARPARLEGWQRAFTHLSTSRWGRPDRPCPTLGLVPGNECWGLAFELPRGTERATLRMLARREGADRYERRLLPLEVEREPARAWVALSRVAPAEVQAGFDLDALVARLRAAHGSVGNGREYVRALAHALEQHALRDALVEAVWDRLGG